MSYLVLARKWRPQRFEEVIGQPHVVQTITNAISTRRIAHAYLFSGARGVGKTSVARIVAKALNCSEGPTPEPCDHCESCREIARGSSLDVLEIDGASNRGINEIRELRENIRYLPSKSPHKIYIIDEVHMLTGEAFNALLKTLEEPPAHVIFIFATTQPHRIPITILSRCQRFDFRRIAASAISEHLHHIAQTEGIQISDLSLRILAREAEGSMRDAQSLLEQMIAFSGEEIADEDLLEVLGVVDHQALMEAAGALLNGDAMRCLAVVEQLHVRGHDLRRFCQGLAAHVRNLLVVKVSDTPQHLTELTESELAELEHQASQVSTASLQQFFHFLLRGEEELRRCSNPRLALEMILLRLVQLPRVMDIDTIFSRMQALEERLSADQHTATSRCAGHGAREKKLPSTDSRGSPENGDPESRSSGVAESIIARWKQLVGRIAQEKPSLAASLEQVTIREAEGGNLEVDFNGRQFEYEMVMEKENLAVFHRLAGEVFGEPARFSLCAGSRHEQDRHRADLDRERKRQQEALKHPLVTEALELFGGEIVEVRTGPEKSG
jgi:DNA polymerase-3 subunit gamma/tau